MIPEIGHFLLILSFFLCLLLAILGARPKSTLSPLLTKLSLSQGLTLWGAVGVLIYSYGIHDATVWNVTQNSHPNDPMIYRLTAIWGNHEGSMILWNGFLGLFTAMVGIQIRGSKRFKFPVLGFLGGVQGATLMFSILTSNPFLRIPLGEVDSLGFNPLLQDTAITYHPPMLYFGYLGFVVPAALAFGVCRFKSHFQLMTPVILSLFGGWTRLTWGVLTLGITAGSFWAYYELGWGGWWFWDPVENASLLPWGIGLALLHSLALLKKSSRALRHVLLFGFLGFWMSLLGTFLVRSGAVISVHSFASDPTRGAYLLGMLGVYTAIVGKAYYGFIKSFPSGVSLPNYTKEWFLNLNVKAISLSVLVLLLGTLFPIGYQIILDQTVSIDAPFYNQTLVPLGLGLGVMMSIAFSKTLKDMFGEMGIVLMGGILLFWMSGSLIFGIAISIAFWGIAHLGRHWKTLAPSMMLAHGGFFILVIGMTTDSTFKQEVSHTLKVGESFQVMGKQILFKELKPVSESNHKGFKALIQVEGIGELTPERRVYTPQETMTSEVSRKSTGISEWYGALGEAFEGGYWTIRVTYHPLVLLIWVGGVIMALGALLQVFRRPS